MIDNKDDIIHDNDIDYKFFLFPVMRYRTCIMTGDGYLL